MAGKLPPGPPGTSSGPPTGEAGDDDDWASALDEWDSQLDNAFGAEPAAAPATLDEQDPVHTDPSLPMLPVEPGMEAGSSESSFDEPAPLDEPVPLGDAPADAFGLAVETAPELALPSDLASSEDPLGNLFDSDPPAEASVPAAAPVDEAPVAEAPVAEAPPVDGSPAAEVAAAPADAPFDDDDDLEISVELQGALDQAAEAVARAAETEVDDDFYDAIAVVAVEPARPAPAPAPAPEKPEEPVVDEPSFAMERREDDPDRTPLPVAEDEPGFTSALRVVAEPPPQRDLIAVRPVRPETGVPALGTVEFTGRVALDGEDARSFLGLVDTERLLAEPERAAGLAYEGAVLCARLDDATGARERLDAALAADPVHPGALTAARRTALAAGDSAGAAQLAQRELDRASSRERAGLVELGSVLADLRGDHSAARARDVDTAEGEAAAGARYAALAFAEDRAAALAACHSITPVATEPRLTAALDLELARVSKESGPAIERYRAVLAAEGRSLNAGLGLLERAIRAGEGEAEALTRCAEALPPSVLRTTIERRIAALELAQGTPGGRERLAALADGGDELAAVFLLDEPPVANPGDADIARLQMAVGALVDPGQRAAARILLGAAEEARARVGAAIAAYGDAAREFPSDRRAERALERARSLGGDRQAELERHLRVAGTDEARAQWSLVRAAALLLELDRPEEALARATAALELRPTDGEALSLCANAAVALGRGAEAADRFVAAAEASTDDGHAFALRRRAALLFAAAGAVDRALAVVGAVDRVAAAELGRRIAAGEPALLRAALGEVAAANDTGAAQALLERAGLTTQSEDLIDDLRRSVRLAPGLRGAAAVLVRRLRAENPTAAAAVLSERYAALVGGPHAPVGAERRWLALETALAQAEDANDLDSAAALLESVLEPGRTSIEAERARIAQLRGRDPGLSDVYRRALEEAPTPERRAALHYAWAQAARRGGQADRSLEQLRLAHEALPDSAVYLDALERAWEAAGDTARLADLALTRLKDATDTRSKVAAYQRLAFIDECLRGDPASARMSYESVAELDQGNQDAIRRMERLLMAERRGADLVHLYDHVGISAAEPALAVAVSLERARLRRRHAGVELAQAELDAAVDNDLRLALFQDPRCRPALREAFARAGERRDPAARLELAPRLAELVGAGEGGDARAAAIFFVRAAQAALQLGREDEAKARLRDAIARSDAHLPALLTLFDLALRTQDPAAAVDAAEQLQRVYREPGARREAGLVAAAISVRDLGDKPRAMRILRAVLEADPRAELAFRRCVALLTEAQDWSGLAELLAARLQLETDGRRLVALHTEMGRLYRDHLGDRARARAELDAALAQDANAPDALLSLADLDEAEGRYAEAAELLLRRAKVERSRPMLAQLLHRLGVIYGRHLGDAKKAIACLSRVLQVEPDHKSAIELIADAYAKEWDWKGALGALQRLVGLEPDPRRRVALLHRAARIQEEGFKEPRQALALLRSALEIDPMYIPAVEALARYFDRHSDVQSLRVLCDTTARRLRASLSGGPGDAEVFRSLFQVFELRRSPDRAALTAAVIEWLGGATAEEKKAVERLRTREQYPGSALADAAVDELLFDGRVPAGFRNLIRLIEEPLWKSLRADVRTLGLQKSDRLPKSGHAVRDVANRVAADLGLGEFDVYVASALGKKALIELAEPMALCIGAELLEGAHELMLRFLVARAFKMAQLRLTVAMRLPPESLAALVAAVVRQYVPDFQPAGVDPAAIAAEVTRVQRAIPRKLAGELHPFALECEAAQLLELSAGLQAAADRAGLLACGAPGPALAMLDKMGLPDAARALALFVTGEELPELRRLVGTSIG